VVPYPALDVTTSGEQERLQIGMLAEGVQEINGQHTKLACVNQDYMGQNGAKATEQRGMFQKQLVLMVTEREIHLLTIHSTNALEFVG
jgi:ribonucleotide monophosphatase NagD (HAD superfamily)